MGTGGNHTHRMLALNLNESDELAAVEDNVDYCVPCSQLALFFWIGTRPIVNFTIRIIQKPIIGLSFR